MFPRYLPLKTGNTAHHSGAQHTNGERCRWLWFTPKHSLGARRKAWQYWSNISSSVPWYPGRRWWRWRLWPRAHLYSLTLCTEMAATPLSGSDVMAMRNEGDESQTYSHPAQSPYILSCWRCVCVRRGWGIKVRICTPWMLHFIWKALWVIHIPYSVFLTCFSFEYLKKNICQEEITRSGGPQVEVTAVQIVQSAA